MAEPLDGRLAAPSRTRATQAPAGTLVLDLTGTACVRVGGAERVVVAPALATARRDPARTPRGRAAPVARLAQLAEDLFADPGRTVTVRAEMSRLRRAVGSVLHTKPYRVSPAVVASVELPADLAEVLPGSSAPVVRALRAGPAQCIERFS